MKIFWRILLAIIILFGVLILLTPKHHSIVREIVINAPQVLIHDQINDLERWNTWSPWEQTDPTIKKKFGIPTSGRGASYTWESKKSGSGKLTITNSTPDTIATSIEFEGMGTAKSKYAFAKEDKNIKVSWSFIYDTPIPWNAVAWIMGGEKSVGKDFERGLASLKQVCEQLKTTAERQYRGYNLKTFDLPMTLYAFKRSNVDLKEIPSFLGQGFADLNKTIADQKINVVGPNSTLYWNIDFKKGKSDLAAAIPVNKTISGNAQMSTIELGGKAVMLDCIGNYGRLDNAHNAIADFLKEKNLKRRLPAIEQYTIDARSNADSTKWLTKIIYFLE